MRSLIWKEVRQQLGWMFVALVPATFLWFGMANVWDQLVRPPNETGLWILTLPLAYAFVLAQWQFGRDGDTRQFGLLVHRSQGARGYFTSKVLVGVAALACVVVLPMTIWALTMSILSPDAALIRWVRIPQWSLVCVPALLVYALGVLSTQLRRGKLLRWGVAISGIFGAFVIILPLALMVGPARLWVAGWIGIDLLAAAGVLWLARSLLLQARDRDLPLRDRQLVGVALVAFLILLPFGSFLLGSVASSNLSTIVESKPAILFDPAAQELVVAGRTEDGWRRLAGPSGATGDLKQVHAYNFTDAEDRPLEVVHYAGSMVVEGAEEAREYLEAVSKCRTISDRAPREHTGTWMQPVAAPAADAPEAPIGKRWTVQVEFDEDGALRIDASRTAESLPPLQVRVSRPDGKFSPKAGFLGFQPHAPLVLDGADGTLWRVHLERDGARLLPLELPQGDRVTGIEPLFQRNAALLGRFEQQYFDSEEQRSVCVLVGRQGKYLVLGDRVVPLDAASQPKDSVTHDEARTLARYAVTSTWPDAFTEVLHVEQLADHKTVFEYTAEPETSSARFAAALYAGLYFLRAPAVVLGERLGIASADAGIKIAPFASQKQLFADGRHPLLFALVMLGGAFQLFLGWRWMSRGGAGVGTRIVYLLLIATGGVVALILTRLLLPRGPHGAAAGAGVRRESVAPVPA